MQPNPDIPDSIEKIADPPTVLVVDDDPVFRDLEARALCEQGYHVLQADGPAAAIKLVGETIAIHLLLTDFAMPGVDGLELVRQFRALRPGTPVVMVSGSLPLIPSRVKELDRFALLQKSSTFDELLRKVRALLTEVAPLPFRTESQRGMKSE